MWLPSGARIMNSTGAPGVRIGSGSTSTPSALSRLCSARTSGVSTPIPLPPGRVPHRGLGREPRPRAGRSHLQPAVLAVLAEPRVAADLEAELLGVEGE